MPGPRLTDQLLRLAGALALTVLVFWGAAWAYLPARPELWWIAVATLIAEAMLDLRPLAEAVRADRGARRG